MSRVTLPEKFDLDTEIDAWCREIINQHCAPVGHLDELKDHMYCLVEDLTQTGMTEAEAFSQALRQMGESDLIAAEYGKNTHLLRKIAAFDRRFTIRIGKRFSAGQITAFILGWSLLAAAMMLWTADLFPENSSLTTMIIAIWFVPYAVAASIPQLRKAECLWWRRLLSRH